ncbi:uncharacterized protein LOC116005046 [Ipomoea triloba]|uniref:uncharacterized protein LOC116005046 n=1 Tax=Ipomoea triloba TaxID=35885 RepID=UPI00125D1E10|nr:uncharacterized protein LOC116005046 [Ipomoea triloba]XP_031101133.1 uncharacterized protein LOC116005046 [Ipomoea triloba]
MEKYLIPVAPASQNPKPSRRQQWQRILFELNGKVDRKSLQNASALLTQSYSMVMGFPHTYHDNGRPCAAHINWFRGGSFSFNNRNLIGSEAVSALEFDRKGVYLASVTKSGCLTVHDFEDLFYEGKVFPLGFKEDEEKLLLHISTHNRLDVVRWNICNQNEVASTSLKSSEVRIYDIGYISSEPVDVLSKRSTISMHGYSQRGLSDIAFSSSDNSRLYASDFSGVVNVWDRRLSGLPCHELRTNCSDAITSIKLNADNQVMFGASKHGFIYMWDIRGGRSSTAFQNNTEYYSPLVSVKLATELGKITSLKAQSNVHLKEIHSIDINPSCQYQLAFHLDDGWSGVFDVNSLRVTHVHCPPPAWLRDNIDCLGNICHLRKPSWLPNYSIYAIGSESDDGIHLLDFYPDRSSPCHVNFDEEIEGTNQVQHQHRQNKFIPLSEGVTACTVHPLTGTIVAGTKSSSLLVISQASVSCPGDDHCQRCNSNATKAPEHVDASQD